MTKIKYSVSRAINGVTLNGDEYLLTEMGNVRVFDSIQEIEEALGIKEEDFDDAGINLHTFDDGAWEKRCAAVNALHELGYGCVILWHVDDLLGNLVDWGHEEDALAEDEAMEILESIEGNHDASLGVHWYTLQDATRTFIQQKND